jgi:hypothetical protein
MYDIDACPVGCSVKLTDDAFDSMNDFRLQEIAVLKSEIGDLVKA